MNLSTLNKQCDSILDSTKAIIRNAEALNRVEVWVRQTKVSKLRHEIEGH